MKAPSFPFYPGDWLRSDISGCSLEAQGLWLRLMIIMHDAQIYGQLILNNAPMPPEFIAKKVGISPKKYLNLLQELESAGGIKRKENGVIFSGHMERDEYARQQNRARQQKHRESGNGESNGDVTEEKVEESRSSNGESNGSLPFPLHFPVSSSDLKGLIAWGARSEKFSNEDPRKIEIAIIETLIQKGGGSPIKSINYFNEEIQRICTKSEAIQSSATIDAMLMKRRADLRKAKNVFKGEQS